MTGVPFAESKAQIAGFYIINADNLDAALAWARKVADTTNHSIESAHFKRRDTLKHNSVAQVVD